MRMMMGQVDMLQHLATLAKGPVQKIEVLVRVVSSLFDINPSMSTHMAVPLWKRCVATLLEVKFCSFMSIRQTALLIACYLPSFGQCLAGPTRTSSRIFSVLCTHTRARALPQPRCYI